MCKCHICLDVFYTNIITISRCRRKHKVKTQKEIKTPYARRQPEVFSIGRCKILSDAAEASIGRTDNISRYYPHNNYITICYKSQYNKLFYSILFTDTIMKTVCEKGWMKMYTRLRDLREDHDLKQRDIAHMLNCTQVCYSYYEMGQRDIPTDVLVSLALYYKTSVDYILRLTDESKPYKRSKYSREDIPK